MVYGTMRDIQTQFEIDDAALNYLTSPGATPMRSILVESHDAPSDVVLDTATRQQRAIAFNLKMQ